MKHTIICAILDDEPFAVRLLEDYVRKTERLELVYAGSDAHTIIHLIHKEKVDLVFLDIQMPNLNGMDVMDMVKVNQNFIITSAYQEYALDAFKFNVIDFLLKPISYAQFYKSIQKYIQWEKSFYSKIQEEHIFVKADRKHFRIPIQSITYIEGLKDYIRIHTEREKIVVYETMKGILKRLPENKFIRIHRSFIISFTRLKVMECHRIWLDNEVQLPIGETYKKRVSERFKNE